VGGVTATTLVRVGRREIALPLFRAPVSWSFSTVPAGGNGSVSVDRDELDLAFDFSGTTRAAYAGTRVDMLGDPRALSVDVRGDGSGAGVRAAFANSRGERVLVTIARRVDWRGWQRRVAPLPPSAVPPLRLLSLYVVGSLGGEPARGSGTIAFRDLRATFAGTSTPEQPFAIPQNR
jgi:hypothetical protein